MTLARNVFPTESTLPETIEIIHCATAGRIVGIRLACGTFLYVSPADAPNFRQLLRASESAISYTAGADALVQAAKDDAEWTERLDREDWEAKTRAALADEMESRLQEEASEIASQMTDELSRQLDDANDTIRELRDDVEERQSRVEELCEEIESLKEGRQ